jgi:fatty acid desaturase
LTAPPIPRAQLAVLNELRNGPAALRIASHLLTIVAAGLVWGRQDWPLAVRLAGLVLLGVALATSFAGLHECSHRTAFRTRASTMAMPGCWGCSACTTPPPTAATTSGTTATPTSRGWIRNWMTRCPPALAAYLLEISGWHWWSGKVASFARLLWGDLTAVPYFNGEVIPQAAPLGLAAGVALCGLLGAFSLIGASGFLLWFWLLPLAVGQPLLRFLLLAEHSGCSFSTRRHHANTRTTRTTLAGALADVEHAVSRRAPPCTPRSPSTPCRRPTGTSPPTCSTLIRATWRCTASCWPTCRPWPCPKPAAQAA